MKSRIQNLFRASVAVPAGLLFLGVAQPVLASEFTERNAGPSKKQMLARTGDASIEGMAFVRPVLSGVLYRGGFHGGDKSRSGLSGNQRTELCEKGFSKAYYADFGTKTKYGDTTCSEGKLSYAKARSSSPSSVMKSIHEVIENPEQGPVMVHCMWGVHSSGALSAMALVQFCGWSEDRAKTYWNEARNNAPCSGGCDSWIDGKFKSFKYDATLKISDAQKAQICPK